MHHSGLLWSTAIVMWGLTLAGAAADIRQSLFEAALCAACIASLAALAASCIASLAEQISDRLGSHVTSRIDRAYLAMAKAFIQSPTPAESAVRHLSLRRGKARP